MDTLLILPKNESEQIAVKAFCQALNVAYEEEPRAENYNPEFIAKIKRSEEDFKAGRVHKISLDEIWK
jgi:hypothetical protein